MPKPTNSIPTQLQTALTSVRVGLTPFEGVIGFGVRDKSGTAVYYCRFQPDGKVEVVQRDEDAADVDPVVVVVMKQSQWQQLAACEKADAPRIIHEVGPKITGHLPSFIRHLHAVVDAIKLAAPVLSA